MQIKLVVGGGCGGGGGGMCLCVCVCVCVGATCMAGDLLFKVI